MQVLSPEPLDAPSLLAGIPIVHGGNLVAARQRFPDAPTPWIDLSTGINPHAYPVGTVPGEAWQRLPEPAVLAEVEGLAARAYGAPASAHVVAAPGTQALIQLLSLVQPAGRVAVLGFGYQEHPAAWRAAGAAVLVSETMAELETADVAVVVNPNNPDGRLADPAVLARLAGRLAARGGLLVVDEAFMDVVDPALSLVPRLPAEGAVVLRSFGKFFGLAGVRLGFAVTGEALARRLRATLGPWPVAGPALVVAGRALPDAAWQRAEVARLRAASARLDGLLSRAGLGLVGGTPLFRLADSPAAAAWFERLGRAGLLVRPFADRPGWLRFGLPGDEPAWERLAAALAFGPLRL